MSSDYEAQLSKLGVKTNEVLSSLNLKEEPYTIFLSGSVIEGYGNAESDIDVFVIYPTDIPSQRIDLAWDTNVISLEYIANRRVDIEHWAKQQAFSVAQRLQDCPPGLDHWSECVKVTQNDIEFAHSVRIGVPLRHKEHFEQLRAAFDYTHLSRILLTRYVYYYGCALEDASGAIASKQHGAALITSRSTLQYAVDAFLAGKGETNTKDKWRFFKLEKVEDPILMEQYWALETPQISNRDDVLRHAEQCLRFANSLALKAQR